MAQLQRTLGPVLIWGLGVGYVVSGAYFGWNLGLPVGTLRCGPRWTTRHAGRDRKF